jgi:hypothetical protein
VVCCVSRDKTRFPGTVIIIRALAVIILFFVLHRNNDNGYFRVADNLIGNTTQKEFIKPAFSQCSHYYEVTHLTHKPLSDS